MNRTDLKPLMCLAGCALCVVAGATGFSFTAWEMCDPTGGNVVYHGGYATDQELFTHMPPPNNAWGPAPNASTIDFGQTTGIAIGFAYFKYFRTSLFVPSAMAADSLQITAVNVDDVVDVVVNGVDTGVYVNTHNDVKPLLGTIAGQTNDILFRFADVYIIAEVSGIHILDSTTGQTAVLVPEPTWGGALFVGFMCAATWHRRRSQYLRA